jgi:hypothetical protein
MTSTTRQGTRPGESLTQSDPGERGEHETDTLLVGADSDQSPVLSVVMPTLNEEEGVRECIDRIKTAAGELGVPTEVVVSDSSTDRTPEIAEAAGAIVVEPDGPGYGYAYRYAFERARGDIIAMGDADTTYDFEELPKLVAELERTGADMVMGSRLDGTIKPGAMPALHEHVGNPLLTGFLNVFYGTEVSDAHSGFRVFTRDALEAMDLETDGMEFASEMVMAASAADLDVAEVPITYHEREGEETLDSFRDGWRHVRFMLTNAPTYLFAGPGVGACVFGVLLLLFAATGTAVFGRSFGVNSMIAGSVFAIVGTHAVALAVFSRVAGRTIGQPTDPVTTFLVEHVSVERGVGAGLALFVAGVGYALYLVWTWAGSGFSVVPPTTQSLLACLGIILGLQTVFSSFFLSVIE